MKARVFGLRRDGPRLGQRGRVSYAAGSALISFALGCGGDGLVVGEEMARVGDVGSGESESTAATAAGSNAAVALVAECPPSPAERQALLGCWPTRHLGRWRGFFMGNPSYELANGSVRDFPLGDLVLTLELGGSGSLTFGAAAPPAPPTAAGDAPLCAGTLPAAGCLGPLQIIVGFVYSLEQIEMLDADVEPNSRITGELPLPIGERLYFGIPLGQPWQTDAPRKCGAEGCFVVGQSLPISLTMSEDGQALRGAYVPLAQNQRPGRVEFLRESGP